MKTLERLEALERDLRQIETGDRLLLLIAADLGGLLSAHRELERIAVVDAGARIAGRAFLEGLVALRNLELEEQAESMTAHARTRP